MDEAMCWSNPITFSYVKTIPKFKSVAIVTHVAYIPSALCTIPKNISANMFSVKKKAGCYTGNFYTKYDLFRGCIITNQ